MEVILITPNPKYSTLVSASKVIESSNVDIVNIIETEVFLNNHHNVSFYCIRNNFPYQFHYPLTASKYLLDRNEGGVELSISNGLHFKIESDTDTLEILSNLQNSLLWSEQESEMTFTIKFEEISIKLIILNEISNDHKLKEPICNLPNESTPKELNRILLYIDENNCEDFLSWTENENDFYDFVLHEKLKKEYAKIKQEIENEKSSFRNKIKMVETILGENINIEKLLNEEKEENLEYKRLKEIFETIKNIDNVIIEQEKNIDASTKVLQEKKVSKSTFHYECCKKFTNHKNEIYALIKELEHLEYKVECANKEKEVFNAKRSFEPFENPNVSLALNEQVNQCKNIAKSVSTACESRNSRKKENIELSCKNKTIQSLQKSEKREIEKYQSLLKKRANDNLNAKREHENNFSKEKSINEEMLILEQSLKNMANYCNQNHQLIAEIEQKMNQKKCSSLHVSRSIEKNRETKEIMKGYQNIFWDPKEYPVLIELISEKAPLQALEEQEPKVTTLKGVGSALSLTHKLSSFRVDEEKEKKNAMNFPTLYSNGGKKETTSTLTKTSIKPKFHEQREPKRSFYVR